MQPIEGKKNKITSIQCFNSVFIRSLFSHRGGPCGTVSSKSRAFAAVRKCTRSENPAPEMGTLLVYWSVPYKILTNCTLIIDIKRCQHTYIHTYICLTQKEKKHGADGRNSSSLSNPPCPSHLRKNQASYYDLFKCFQLKHLLTYCSMEVFYIKGG